MLRGGVTRGQTTLTSELQDQAVGWSAGIQPHLYAQVLYSKLSLTLGITWSFEPISEVLQSFNLCGDICHHLTIVLGAINLLRGFFFFLIFVCKRSTLGKVRRELPWGGGEGGETDLQLARVDRLKRLQKQATMSLTLSEELSECLPEVLSECLPEKLSECLPEELTECLPGELTKGHTEELSLNKFEQ